MAVVEGGDVWAWGCNSSGRLGDGTWTDRSTPVKVRLQGTIQGAITPRREVSTRVIAAGGAHSAALVQGECWSWGLNLYGQLGDGTVTERSLPVRVRLQEQVIAIVAGHLHTLAFSAKGQCWAW